MKRAVFLLLIPFLFFSCGYVDESKSSKWLFAVYMMGDNSLSDAATYDLQEMMNVGSDDNVRIVVLCDRGEGTTLYEVKKNFLEPVETFGNLNTGDSKTLKLFINSIKNNYTFENLALVFWDHGNGWDIAGVDETSEDFLWVKEAYNALNETNTKVNLLGFDECLTGMTEVFYTFKDMANVTVASEFYEPGYGWDYFGAISRFKSNGNLTYENLAKAIVDSYYDFYLDYKEMPVTLAYVTRDTINNLVSALDNLTALFSSSTKTDFAYARNASLPIDTSSEYTPKYIDLYSFADGLLSYSTNTDIQKIADSMKTAISSIYFKTTDNSNYFRGVSIYFPESYLDADESYFNYTYNKFTETKWDDFLKAYLGI